MNFSRSRVVAAPCGRRRAWDRNKRKISAHKTRSSHSEAATRAKGVQVASGGYRVAGEKDQRKLKKA